MLSKSEIWLFAESRLKQSEAEARSIQLSNQIKASADIERTKSLMESIENISSKYTQVGSGAKGIAVVLSVDMRKSSHRSELLSAKAMYQTMHTFLPTMALVTNDLKGEILNYRGDGLIALFGLQLENDSKFDFEHWKPSDHLSIAAKCGQGLIDTTADILDELFRRYEIACDGLPLKVGVGIDFSGIVLTKIGLHDSLGGHEITAYGHSINKACKLSDGNNEIRITHEVEKNFPSGKGGKVRFGLVHSHKVKNARTLIYPNKVVK